MYNSYVRKIHELRINPIFYLSTKLLTAFIRFNPRILFLSREFIMMNHHSKFLTALGVLALCEHHSNMSTTLLSLFFDCLTRKD